MRKLHKWLDHPDDLISVSLDVDLNGDKTSLQEYVQEYGMKDAETLRKNVEPYPAP
ncbi:MAG TPA: hypothetical protein VK249_33735 [Anaerolineales bacterium]|nr:hypothetical protein [Anaerolineales bacterium]